ncbi:MAG: hypothetical protein JSS66_17000 [Armatimonadetes bacterium]|nr:hypothetical protein [Armatimonadota bacterium]
MQPIEIGLALVAVPACKIRQSDLATWEQMAKDENSQYNLYFIVRQPRVTLIPKDGPKGTTESLLLAMQTPTGTEQEEVELKVQGAPANSYFVSDPPHSKFRLISNGKTYPDINVADYALGVFEELSKLELVYVGQTFGEDGERTIQQRLEQHATFQKILADTSENAPHLEVWIMPVRLVPSGLAMLRIGKDSESVSAEAILRMSEFLLEYKFPRKEEVNLGEAALIRYFQPRYNIKFKASFPDKSHTSYATVFADDYNCVAAEVGLEGTGYEIFSDVVEPSAHPIAEFPLIADEDRFQMLDASTWSQ